MRTEKGQTTARVNGVVLALCVFFFNDTATTEIYTLSLHDALPISLRSDTWAAADPSGPALSQPPPDRKSTRLNSSHGSISYAVFCLQKNTHTANFSRNTFERMFTFRSKYITFVN